MNLSFKEYIDYSNTEEILKLSNQILKSKFSKIIFNVILNH